MTATSAMKVLVIDDDIDITDFLESHLPERGFAVDSANDGSSGIRLACMNEYDLILLDLNLPDMTGETIVETLHERERVPPIIMLTVVADSSSKVRFLNAGADDYLVKPFLFDELIARMRALLRRSDHRTPDVITIGDVVVDSNAQTVHRAGEHIPLTRKEFALLEQLARAQGTVLSKGALIEHVWDSSANAFSSAIDTHMTNLRRKLGDPEIIRTLHGRGYTID